MDFALSVPFTMSLSTINGVILKFTVIAQSMTFLAYASTSWLYLVCYAMMHYKGPSLQHFCFLYMLESRSKLYNMLLNICSKHYFHVSCQYSSDIIKYSSNCVVPLSYVLTVLYLYTVTLNHVAFTKVQLEHD